jgi:hypothetical protein
MFYGTAVRDPKYFLQAGLFTELLALSESVASSRGSIPIVREVSFSLLQLPTANCSLISGLAVWGRYKMLRSYLQRVGCL